jgi:hypothetical protein
MIGYLLVPNARERPCTDLQTKWNSKTISIDADMVDPWLIRLRITSWC